MLTRAALAFILTAGSAAAFELSSPVDCEVGRDCFIQQYVDHDRGSGARDYACGTQTYDSHDGTDFRLPSLAEVARGTAVIAAAGGTVIGVRDGMEDRLARTAADRAAIADRECGNGVLIDHGEGWQTQYCHMRQGSVAVKKDERVESGSRLGLIGYSGDAAFPHVHLTVRKDGKAIDPFRPDDPSGCGEAGPSLWSDAALTKLRYRQGEIIALGFAQGAVELEDLETGIVQAQLPSAAAEALVAYVWAINLRQGDAITIRLVGADGDVLANNRAVLDRSKAQYMLFAGRKRPADGWPIGIYKATVDITRNGASALTRTGTLIID